MSHYCVLVLTDEDTSVEELLAPYDENISVEPYVLYTKDELIAKEKAEIKRYKETTYAEFLKDPEGYKERNKHNPQHLNYIEHEFRKKLYWTNARIYKEAIRYYEPENIMEDGSVLSTYNPQSKWDWYVEGGRWSGMLRLKVTDDYPSGGCTDSAYADEVDFSPCKEDYDDAVDFWELIVEGREPKNEDEKNILSFYNKDFYLNKYSTKEKYAEYQSAFRTYAVVTPDGEWHEPGRMGWFGCSFATEEDEKVYYENYHKFIEDAIENNWLLTVVDCHI